MGKSTTAAMFREAGVPVHDSDEAVHRIYAGPAAPLIERAFPGTVVDGVVDRQLLSEKVIGKPEELRRLESIIHPLVREDADAFLREARDRGEKAGLARHSAAVRDRWHRPRGPHRRRHGAGGCAAGAGFGAAPA